MYFRQDTDFAFLFNRARITWKVLVP
jgi:hypothetical protein